MKGFLSNITGWAIKVWMDPKSALIAFFRNITGIGLLLLVVWSDKQLSASYDPLAVDRWQGFLGGIILCAAVLYLFRMLHFRKIQEDMRGSFQHYAVKELQVMDARVSNCGYASSSMLTFGFTLLLATLM